MVYCFSCGAMLAPGLGCAICRGAQPLAPAAGREREVPSGRPVLTLVKTFPRLSLVEPPPHAAA